MFLNSFWASGTLEFNAICVCRLDAFKYKGRWVLLFFYPKDFTFVCPTEIIAFNDRAHEFEKRNCAVIGASCDSAEVHLAWMRTARKQGGLGHMEIPLLADVTRSVSSAYGALNASNITNRAIYLINPQVCIREAFLAEVSVRSPRKLFIFVM